MTEALHKRYRPQSFDEVIGQDAAVKALKRVIKANSSQAFLFSGPAGTGKTTLARLAAVEIGCLEKDIQEIAAAVFTGVDSMRELQSNLQYSPFGKSKSRAVILDECHALSKNAWQSLLKVTEEPPAHVYWFLCTTEPGKVPDTIKSRFTPLRLKALSDKDLTKLIAWVCKEEGIKLNPSISDIIIREAQGSPRQALVYLAICRDITDRKEAAELIRSALESDATIALAQFLVKGGSWVKAMSLVTALADENPESVRIVISNYMAAVARNAKSEQAAAHCLTVMDAFSQPFHQSADLILAIGRALYSGDQ